MGNFYFDIPEELRKKHVHGSSSSLYKKLKEELKGAKEISISFFLYNNPFLQSYFETLGNEGCKIKIYSIPLKGYDRKKVKLHKNNYCDSHTIETSKLDYANSVYNRLLNGKKNLELKIFPHTYLWNVQFFSRGTDAYSLHNKSILAVFENEFKCILSSCNFAIGDPPHSDNFLVISDDNSTLRMYEKYFSLLDKNSLSIKDYIEWEKENHDFQFEVTAENIIDDNFKDYFTAPFIKYNNIGSNRYVQGKIIELIQKAESEIWICSQHFSDYKSFDPKAKSIVDELSKLDKSINIKILKQTRSKHQKQGGRTLKTEEFLRDFQNVSQKYWNPVIHDKFIIVDQKLLISTGNFTPTQFAWRENHKAEYKIKDKTYKVNTTFSEVNSYSFIEDQQIVTEYQTYFNELWEKSNFVF